MLKLSKVAVLRVPASFRCSSASLPEDVRAPLKKPRDPMSVLRVLDSTTKPQTSSPYYQLIDDPMLSGFANSALLVKAKVAGRAAARIAMRDYFANDIATLATEEPRIDRYMPLKTPQSIVAEVEADRLSLDQGMQMLVDALACREAWALFEKNEDHDWPEAVLQDLLELLARANGGGRNDRYFFGFPVADFDSMPDPDELYVRAELLRLNNLAARNKEPVSAEAQEPTWQPDGLAEQLFSRQQAKLRNARGYRSMIRGAAKHQNLARALELADACEWRDLTRPVFEEMLRVAHLSTKGDVWSTLKLICEKMEAASFSPDVATFNAIFACLRGLVESNDVSNGLELISKTLGLLTMMEKEHRLEPNLATYSNILRLFSAVKLPSAGDSGSTQNAVDCSAFLNSSLKHLQRIWERDGMPTKADNFNEDDLLYFPAAMGLARRLRMMRTANQLYSILFIQQDRRFLLQNSVVLNQFVLDYVQLILQIQLPQVKDTPEAMDQKLNFFWDRYVDHRFTVLASWRCVAAIARSMGRLTYPQYPLAVSCKAQLCLADMLRDIFYKLSNPRNLTANTEQLLRQLGRKVKSLSKQCTSVEKVEEKAELAKLGLLCHEACGLLYNKMKDFYAEKERRGGRGETTVKTDLPLPPTLKELNFDGSVTEGDCLAGVFDSLSKADLNSLLDLAMAPWYFDCVNAHVSLQLVLDILTLAVRRKRHTWSMLLEAARVALSQRDPKYVWEILNHSESLPEDQDRQAARGVSPALVEELLTYCQQHSEVSKNKPEELSRNRRTISRLRNFLDASKEEQNVTVEAQ